MMGDGLYLIVDALARQKLTRAQVRDFLVAMPTQEYLDMTLILGPAVYRTQHGWAGACIIAESHITMHCNGIEVHADIFSCKPYDPQKVLAYCQEELGLEHIKAQLLRRGWAADDAPHP